MSWKHGASALTPATGALLELAAMESRVLITIDTDFGELVYRHDVSHAGLLRLPDVPAEQRIVLVTAVIDRHGEALENRAIVTVRGERIRISLPQGS